MSVKIRLARRGRKKLAIFDIVVADARAPRDGRFIEKLGTYNPTTNPATIVLAEDKAVKWLLNGAQPTDTTKAILSYKGVLYRKHLQIGVNKGAITQETADARYEEWKTNKDAKIAGKVDGLAAKKEAAKKAQFELEAKKNADRAEAIAKKNIVVEEEAPAAEEAAAPAEETTEGEAQV
jgi:small subunit ribosomal protein S16